MQQWSIYTLYSFTSILGVFFPVVGVLLAHSIPDWGYVDSDFLCLPLNANLWYYSITLPLNILLAIGISLFILTFWKLHKVREY